MTFSVEKKLINQPKAGTKWSSLAWGKVSHFWLLDLDRKHAFSLCGLQGVQNNLHFYADMPECKNCRNVINREKAKEQR